MSTGDGFKDIKQSWLRWLVLLPGVFFLRILTLSFPYFFSLIPNNSQLEEISKLILLIRQSVCLNIILILCCVVLLFKNPIQKKRTKTTLHYLISYKNFKWHIIIDSSKSLTINGNPWCFEHEKEYVKQNATLKKGSSVNTHLYCPICKNTDIPKDIDVDHFKEIEQFKKEIQSVYNAEGLKGFSKPKKLKHLN